MNIFFLLPKKIKKIVSYNNNIMKYTILIINNIIITIKVL